MLTYCRRVDSPFRNPSSDSIRVAREQFPEGIVGQVVVSGSHKRSGRGRGVGRHGRMSNRGVAALLRLSADPGDCDGSIQFVVHG